jgi:hypothetical protein
MPRIGRGGSTGSRIGVGNAKDRPGGIDGLKNWSGKCEGPGGGGGRRGKEPE